MEKHPAYAVIENRDVTVQAMDDEAPVDGISIKARKTDWMFGFPGGALLVKDIPVAAGPARRVTSWAIRHGNREIARIAVSEPVVIPEFEDFCFKRAVVVPEHLPPAPRETAAA